MTSSLTTYPVMEDGERLKKSARKAAMEEGDASTLEELCRTG